MIERIIACIPPNPRMVGYIDPIHEPLDGPLYMGSHIHQQYDRILISMYGCKTMDFLTCMGSLAPCDVHA